MRVLLDLEGYQVVPQGQNELLPIDMSGKIKAEFTSLKKDEFTITVEPEYTETDIYIEFYLTLEKPENKGLFVIKRAYLILPVVKVEEAEKLQEQIYKPILLRN